MPGINGKVRVAVSAIFIAVFAACGGGGGGGAGSNSAGNFPGGIHLQTVSFGDSLSDVGTFAPIVVPMQFFAGKDKEPRRVAISAEQLRECLSFLIADWVPLKCRYRAKIRRPDGYARNLLTVRRLV